MRGRTGGEVCNLDELHNSDLFEQSKAQYAPGYEAHSLLTDPRFRKIAADGDFHPLDDLRLGAESPARSAGVALPPTCKRLMTLLELRTTP